MDFRMQFLTLLLCVTPVIVKAISISPNGNSPQVKMIGGMMVDVQKGFLPMTPRTVQENNSKSNYDISRQLNANATKLALNERYRRLIPYMTFYYANDLAAAPPSDITRHIEVEKAQIVEAKELANQRDPKKIHYSQRNIPRYQGNRLTHYNIASANPTRIYYKDGVPFYQNKLPVTPNYNPLLSEYISARVVQKPPSPAINPAIKRPYIHLYREELPNIRYYLSEKEQAPKYKLVPYEQTPPVKVSYVQPPPPRIPLDAGTAKVPNEPAIPVKISYEPTKIPYEPPAPKIPIDHSPAKVAYVQQPIAKPAVSQSVVKQSSYEQSPVNTAYEQRPVKNSYEQAPLKVLHEVHPVKIPLESAGKVNYEEKLPESDHIYEPKKPVLVSVLVPQELYVKPRPVRPSFVYDNANSNLARKQPAIVSESYYEKQRPQAVVIESGFKPIVSPTAYSTEAPKYTSTLSPVNVESDDYDFDKENFEAAPERPDSRPNYYEYVVNQPTVESVKENSPSAVTLASLLNSLQVNKSIPKPITKENVASSIRTLLQVLNRLKAVQAGDVVVKKPLLSTPKPFIANKEVEAAGNPETDSESLDPDLHEEPYLAEVHVPSQHLDDDYTSLKGGQRPSSSQQFPLPITSDDEGGTPGVPGDDYPIFSVIPPTSFDCKTQRYKGFFADTETRCQVWHYCDLNGGQASFLCPNGTIFSQAGLTCDWWFNVKCDTTTQLYVLNESLYKYILPHSPKFPEDYSGPLVDKYLTLKFKEMEEEFKKNKSKSDKDDSEEDEEDETEDNDPPKTSGEMDKRQLSDISEASVIVETPGTSGKVERLHDD